MSKNKLKAVFIGTSGFGVPSLQSLIDSEHFELSFLITQPDKKAGRKMQLQSPPVKQFALANNITLLQPSNIIETEADLKKVNPDIIITAAYAQIIPEPILKIPKYGCINIHASLLPKYRGASCIQAALLNGDEKSGVTIIKMDKGLDTGAIIKKSELKIAADEDAGTLFEKLACLAGEIIVSALIEYCEGKITPRPQDDSKVSYVGLLTKENGRIDPGENAENVINHIRAMTPWPGAFMEYKEKRIKILEAERIVNEKKKTAGELFTRQKKTALQCKDAAIIIKKLQLAGKKAISGEDFARGYLSKL